MRIEMKKNIQEILLVLAVGIGGIVSVVSALVFAISLGLMGMMFINNDPDLGRTGILTLICIIGCLLSVPLFIFGINRSSYLKEN